MNIKIAAAAAAVCLGAAACDQGERQVADRDTTAASDQAARERAGGPGASGENAAAPGGAGQAGGATTAAPGRPAPNDTAGAPGVGGAVTDAQRAGSPASDSASSDSLGQRTANAAQDAVGGLAGQANAAITGGDTNAFLRNAAYSDMYEIEAGQIALQKSENTDIRDFAQMIIDDHRMMSAEVKAAAMEGQVTFTPPATLDDRRQGMIDNLQAASQGDFDQVFLDQQQSAHEEALTLMRTYVDRGDVTALQTAAREAIPIVEAHLEHVQTMQDAMDSR